MRTFLISLLAISVITLVVEVFCPPKTMKKAVLMAVSLSVLAILMNGIAELIKSNESSIENDIKHKFEISSNNILSTSVNHTTNELRKTLENEGIEVVDIGIDYYLDEFSIVYEEIECEVVDSSHKEKAKAIIQQIMNINEERVIVWANS